MDVSVIGGTGYVGFITGVGLAELGHRVVGLDIDAERIESIRSGRAPIYEAGTDLDGILRRHLDTGRIRFTQDAQAAVRHADVIFIAVGTPEGSDGRADLTQVIRAAEEIGRHIDRYKILVMKSTVPVGTLAVFCEVLGGEGREGSEFDIVSNPEFLREGSGLYDFFHPERIVIGTSSERARATLRELYAPFLEPEDSASAREEDTVWSPQRGTPLVETTVVSAQMIKYASNAYLAARISFINEIAAVCEHVGADVGGVIRGVGLDSRIGPEYLQPGPGYGGPCLEKDIGALVALASDSGYDPQLLRAVIQRNIAQAEIVVQKIKTLAGMPLHRKRIAALGLAFKSGTNDVRTSISIRIIRELVDQGAIVTAHDPVAIDDARRVLRGVEFAGDPYEAAKEADVVVLLTDWPEYAEMDLGRLASVVRRRCFVDARNAMDLDEMTRCGFTYRGLGRSVG